MAELGDVRWNPLAPLSNGVTRVPQDPPGKHGINGNVLVQREHQTGPCLLGPGQREEVLWGPGGAALCGGREDAAREATTDPLWWLHSLSLPVSKDGCLSL